MLIIHGGCCVLFSPRAGNTSHLGLLLCHSYPKDFNNFGFFITRLLHQKKTGWNGSVTRPLLLIFILKTNEMVAPTTLWLSNTATQTAVNDSSIEVEDSHGLSVARLPGADQQGCFSPKAPQSSAQSRPGKTRI